MDEEIEMGWMSAWTPDTEWDGNHDMVFRPGFRAGGYSCAPGWYCSCGERLSN